MTFEGRCIVVQVTSTEWYVAVAPVAQPGAYAVLSKPLGHREASRVCKELNELLPAAPESSRLPDSRGGLPKIPAISGICSQPLATRDLTARM